jgi:hypothetical protein
MRKLLAPLVFIMLLWFPAVAYAADDADTIASLVRMIAHGILNGDYLASAAVTLSLLTTLARISWGIGGIGGRLLLGVQAFAGSVAAALVSGAALSWDVVETAVTIGALAAGGYSLLQPLARWLRPYVERLVPQPLRAVLLAVLRIVDAAPLPPSSQPAGKAISVALLVGLVALSASCATVRRSGAAGAAAGLDCTAPALQAAMTEAGTFARALVISTISGGGEVDAERLRAAARELKTDALRCSLVAAIAAIADAASPPPGAMAAPRLVSGIEPGELRALGRELAATEWGISGPLVVSSGPL